MCKEGEAPVCVTGAARLLLLPSTPAARIKRGRRRCIATCCIVFTPPRQPCSLVGALQVEPGVLSDRIEVLHQLHQLVLRVPHLHVFIDGGAVSRCLQRLDDHQQLAGSRSVLQSMQSEA